MKAYYLYYEADDSTTDYADREELFPDRKAWSREDYTLTRYISYLRAHELSVAITASTGIAASHIGGMTLHSFAGLGISDTLSDDDIARIKAKYYIATRMRKISSLIIDEISMVSPETFEMVDRVLRAVRGRQEPFGGVQVILTGDFFQLPPVRSQTPEITYVWQTPLWDELDLHICYLSESHRHEDPDFLTVLGEIRSGHVSREARDLLNACYKRPLKAEYFTRLYTHNMDVDRINQQQLATLTSEEKIYEIESTGNQKLVETILSTSLVQEKCRIKEGATVIFIKNHPEQLYVNGTLGEVIGFDERDYPVVKTFSGEEVVAEREEWSREDEKGKVLASISQVPLRLAWAITVHKSQGMTIDAAEIDLSKTFEVGQGYVALSRVRSLEGLSLLGANEKSLSVDPEVIKFDGGILAQSDAEEASALSASVDQQQEDAENFILDNNGSLSERSTAPGKKETTEMRTMDFLSQKLTFAEISTIRKISMATILKHVEKLQELGLCPSLSHEVVDPQLLVKCKNAIGSRSKEKSPDDFLDSGRIKLRILFDEFDEEYDYDQIRHAVLVFYAS